MIKTDISNVRSGNSKQISITLERGNKASLKSEFQDSSRLNENSEDSSCVYQNNRSQSLQMSHLITCMSRHQQFLLRAWNESSEQVADKILASKKIGKQQRRALQIDTFERVFTNLFCSSEFCSNICEMLKLQTVLFKQSSQMYFQVKEIFGKIYGLPFEEESN